MLLPTKIIECVFVSIFNTMSWIETMTKKVCNPSLQKMETGGSLKLSGYSAYLKPRAPGSKRDPD